MKLLQTLISRFNRDRGDDFSTAVELFASALLLALTIRILAMS